MDATGIQASERVLSAGWETGRDTLFSDLRGGQRLRLILSFWLGGALVLATYGTLRVYLDESDLRISADVPLLGRNETGAFVGWWQGPWAVPDRKCRVAFDNLRAENTCLDPFATASQKVVMIDNLDVVFLESRQAPGPVDAALTQFHDLLAPPPAGEPYAGLAGLFATFGGEATEWAVSLDLSNTAEVQIRPLDWRLCEDGETVFRVRCRYAQLAAGSSSIVLRGHATVTANGTTLESDCIQMDTRNRQFIIDGPYLLTRDEDRQTGVNACFNAELDGVRRTFHEPVLPPVDGMLAALGLGRLSLACPQPLAPFKMRTPRYEIHPCGPCPRRFTLHQSRFTRPVAAPSDDRNCLQPPAAFLFSPFICHFSFCLLGIPLP